MKWLLWREYRRNRLLLGLGAVLFLWPYLFVLLRDFWSTGGISHYAHDIGKGATWSIIISQLTSALLCSNAIAGERSDRAAEFMAYLPVSRQRRLVSKLNLAIIATAVIWGANFSILSMCGFHWREAASGMSRTAVTGFLMCGVAWCISSFQSSPTFAIAGGILAPILILMNLRYASWVYGVPSLKTIFEIIYPILCGVLGIAGFALGTWYYLRKAEP